MQDSISKNQTIDFQAVRADCPLLDTAGRYVEIIANGSEYKCLCPFHPDKNPSCTFFQGDDGNWRYKCFSCQAQGDVIDWVSQIENIDTGAAARLLQGDKPAESKQAQNQTRPPASKPAHWNCVLPAPDDAPEYDPAKTYSPSKQAMKHYRPERVDAYLDAEGRILCYVIRQTFDGDRKSCITVTYCENSKGECRWCNQRMDVPYPLMGLDELAARPTAHVLLVSGEKCKAAASTRLPINIGGEKKANFVVVTTMGGDSAVLNNDLAPLKNRHVVLFADADKSGRDSMALIGKELDLKKLRHIDVSGLPDKYDIADLIESGISDDDFLQWFKDRITVGNLPEPPIDTTETKRSKTRQKPAQTEPEQAPTEEPEADLYGPISLGDFRAYMPDHRYIFEPTRETWPATSVDARLEWPQISDGNKIKPSKWLDKNAAVEQMTWAPGLPMLIENKLIDTGGWIDRKGCTCFNLYRPPTITHGNAEKAGPWIEHVHKVYPNDAGHIIQWLAQRVQIPAENINHALVLGGKPGIGKDTLLEPAKQAVGPWNCQEISPSVALGRFNSYAKSVILRVSEARDLGDVDRFTFYDHMKSIIAAPPDVIRVDEKHLREYPVPNICGVIITSNYKTNGLYLPEDDRRHYVAWSELDENPFKASYWDELWQWYFHGGFEHVAAYLAHLDLSGFNPKAPPKKTEAFWHMVNSNRAPEDAELADVLDMLQRPDALTLDIIKAGATQQGYSDFAQWLGERKNRRSIPHRLEAVGYEPIRNEAPKDGLWKINRKRQAVYAKSELSIRDRIIAAEKLA